ncbi:LysR family transcriptional regulator [Candidatus Nitrosacidococcus tergens]|uniref:HTH-type transcriptional regulator MetR n=1 Tax=Candidatus Nitrosacidococcus tergens TaxID=553981 RepID=A0A7G1Q9M3_9GAMM|nr:LysR family transcriptional regulator [Candidatus Nitrosacidococcus tergens]CAB1275838.1 HTH-type transcriptional regulator MetR [Candidatus Nitrosacidococcus tergens]
MFIELRHLKTLLSLHEHGSVSKAADHLHLTQSAISHQLKSLEDYFDCPLFIRKSYPLQFTSAGMHLLELATSILPQVESTERDLIGMAQGQLERLHIAVECHSCFQWLLPAMNKFRTQWPKIEMDLSLGFSFEPLPALRRGNIDLVITSDPVDHPDISYEPLFQFQGVLVVSPIHPLSRKSWVDPADLKNEILITYPVEKHRLSIYTHFLDPARINPAGRRTAELTLMILQLVVSNRGVTVLPNWAIVDELAREEVKSLSLGKEGLWATLYAAMRTKEREFHAMKSFTQLARDTCFKHLSGILPVSHEHYSRHTIF